jgi:hypothetical protein
MALLKRASYEREHGKVSDIDYKLYQLRALPLTPTETQEERNQKITDLIRIKLKTIKGTLHKTEKGWVVKWIDTLHGFGGGGWTPMEELLHPDSQKLKKLTEGKEVEFELVYRGSNDMAQYAKLLLKKPHKPTQKECERFIREWVWEFVYKNWDKIDHKKCELDIATKEKFLKEVKKYFETAMWVITDVMSWGMEKNYLTEMEVYSDDYAAFWVFKVNGRYIKVIMNKDHTHTVSFAEPKTKTVTYFE